MKIANFPYETIDTFASIVKINKKYKISIFHLKILIFKKILKNFKNSII